MLDCKNGDLKARQHNQPFVRMCGILNLKNSVLVSGGVRPPGLSLFQSKVTSRVQLFYQRKFQPDTLPSLINRRYAHGIGSVGPFQEVIVVGGVDKNADYYNKCELLRKPVLKWQDMPRLHSKLDAPACGSFNGKYIYTLGGWGMQSGHLNIIEELSLDSLCQGWKILKLKLQKKDNHFSLARVRPDRMILFGGENHSKDFSFTTKPSLSSFNTSISHDTLHNGTCFKVYQGTIFTVTRKLKFKKRGKYQWEDVE